LSSYNLTQTNFKIYASGSSLLRLLFSQTVPTLLARKNMITRSSLRKQYMKNQGIFSSLDIYTTDIIKAYL